MATVTGFEFAYQLTVLVGGITVIACLSVRLAFFFTADIPNWIRSKRQKRAFQKLRKFDEQFEEEY